MLGARAVSRNGDLVPGICATRAVSTDVRRLTTGIRSEKCVVRRFRRANVYLNKPR